MGKWCAKEKYFPVKGPPVKDISGSCYQLIGGFDDRETNNGFMTAYFFETEN